MTPPPFCSQVVIARAAEIHNIPVKDLLGRSKFKEHLHTRFAVVNALHLLGMNDYAIGRRMGGRDHTTIANARKRARQFCETNPGFSDTVDALLESASQRRREVA